MIIILLHRFTIPLDPRTKKNHQKIAGTGGRCPVCRKHARQFIMQGNAGTKYAFQAARFINPRPDRPIDTPVHILYRFFMQTRRRVDTLNLQAAADDLLVSAGV